jgi:hypothetical protein
MPGTHAGGALTREQTDDLLQYLEECLDGRACDGTMRQVKAYLRSRGLKIRETVAWLRDSGAWCDCEVWMNVR